MTLAQQALGQTDPPKEWIDPDTGHKVIRLSTEPGSQSLYFHENAYSLDGQKLVFTIPPQRRGAEVPDAPATIYSVNLKTRQVERVAQGRILQAGRKTNEVFYTRDGVVYAADLNSFQEREVVKIPEGRQVRCINCDEALLAGTLDATDPTGATTRPATRPILPQTQRMFPGRTDLTPEERASAAKEDNLSRRLANAGSQALFTLNIATGEMKTFGYAYAWLNHLQFSPTDPSLLMFCHEGTWHEVDRIWTVRTDGSDLQLRHKREMDMEIAGHEFWGHDGKWIWYDLQTPRSQVFWIAGLNIETGERRRYHLERDWWSIHFNVSHDGKMFCGDGGDPGQVAFAKDGQWINLFRVQPDGTLSREKLVNMSKQNYGRNPGLLEPNVTFTPDDKWIVFRSNMFGPSQVLAVAVDK
ncbi:MAG TPA: oligogalacturonate lyase family protein [Tepidisphaeraceae bacterium]